MDIAIYTLTSALHDEQAVETATREFLESLGIDYVLKGDDYSDYGSHSLNIIYVRTGGTEGLFRQLLPEFQSLSVSPFYLLTSGKSNSLAASMEILSFLKQQSIRGEIIHGSSEYISRRLQLLSKVEASRKALEGCRLGVIGEPSDWLIASHANAQVVRRKLGVELLSIPMKELLQVIANTAEQESKENTALAEVRDALPGAEKIYVALRQLAEQYQLQGFTLRCFDLLTAVQNTGCLALARLNTEGIVAGCEGDVPAMLSMKIAQSLIGVTGFQANPSTIDPETGEIVFAHCTIPFNLVERYELDTHFESGIGVGIRGFMKEGPVTIFKVSGDLSRSFIAEGQLIRNQSEPNLCRTQLVVRLSDISQVNYFFNNPIGNHHIIVPGHHKALFTEFLPYSLS